MAKMQKITPHLWFDKEAKEAAKFYLSVFPNSRITNVNTLHNTPSGDCDIVSFTLSGQEFIAISAGPLFKINPSISFTVVCETKEEVDLLWKKLSKGGKALMELGEYPFSERYGWIQDQYGVSWQLIFFRNHKLKQTISPFLMFVGDVCGKAEEAINFYVSVFKNAKAGEMIRYDKAQKPEQEGTVAHAFFTLEGQEFAALDSAREHNFTFNEAISFIVRCDSQPEIDYYWKKLSQGGEESVCGWLKDKFGVSWQVVPTVMDEMMKDKDPERLARVTEAFLKMKKFDIAELEKAYQGNEK